MDRRSLERLGHLIVSRRVALGYRNRTDLANSLQFTVRTLADIEHGVRRASPGTYAMLENKLAWAPGSIDSILAGGEPHETGQAAPRPPPPARPASATDALSRASTEELLLELRRRIITPREARECGKTGRPEPSGRLARGGLAAAKISGGGVDHAELLIDECGRPSTDVDTNLGQGLRRQIVDGAARLGASRGHPDGVASDLAH